jgi:hypothetical protein
VTARRVRRSAPVASVLGVRVRREEEQGRFLAKIVGKGRAAPEAPVSKKPCPVPQQNLTIDLPGQHKTTTPSPPPIHTTWNSHIVHNKMEIGKVAERSKAPR